MATPLHNVVDWYRDLMDNKSGKTRIQFFCSRSRLNCRKKFYLFTDPRVKDWPMTQSPFPTLAICIFYAYFCKVLAPRWMENRKPFDLKQILIYYNLFQTLFSAWIFLGVSRYLMAENRDCSLMLLLAAPSRWLVAKLQLPMPAR